MTAVKQVSVCSRQHLERMRGYLDWGRDKALAHETWNVIDERNWWREMDETREALGHNRPGRAGARCTYMQHQVLAFNPDECSCNGGPMTPGRCMDYARDYVALRYPDQEVVAVLHLEECRGDGSRRFACHLGVNRSDLATGLRLDERAAAARAATVRALDERYGLRQLERGRAGDSENARVRAAVARGVEEVGRMRSCPDRMGELERRLAHDGVRMCRGARGGLQYEFRSRSLGGTRRVSGARLDFARDRRTGVVVRLTARGIREGIEAFRALERAAERQYEQGNGRA